MKKLIIICLLFSKTVFADVINIDNKELKELLKKGIPIVDVRTKQEWQNTGIIKNSFLISMINEKGRYSFEDWLKRFSDIKLENNSVILICAVGGRSYYLANVVRKIKENVKIYNVKKGIKNWITYNNPIVKYNQN